jgi:4-hydroxy-tetrahydrodipicolinate reductase
MTPNPLRIALVGYGAMGKEIEHLAGAYGCEVTQTYTSARPLVYERISTGAAAELGADFGFDVAIDFSAPSAVADNVRTLAALGKSVVIGTTGWQHTPSTETMRSNVLEASTGAVWSANFSVGVQMFMQIVRSAATLLEAQPDYDVALHELHHRRKLDSPSGTATALAAIIEQAISRKTNILSDTAHGRIAPEALHNTSTRVGAVPGTHTVYLDSAADSIELIHRARNRSGFAIGALRAARWLHGKQGWFDFADVFGEL